MCKVIRRVPNILLLRWGNWSWAILSNLLQQTVFSKNGLNNISHSPPFRQYLTDTLSIKSSGPCSPSPESGCACDYRESIWLPRLARSSMVIELLLLECLCLETSHHVSRKAKQPWRGPGKELRPLAYSTDWAPSWQSVPSCQPGEWAI